MFSGVLSIPDLERPQNAWAAIWSSALGRYLPQAITGAVLSGFVAGQLAFGSATGGLTQDSNLSYVASTGVLTLGKTTATHVISSTVASTSTATGAITVAGGIGVAGQITFGGGIVAKVNSGSTINGDFTDTAASRSVAVLRVNTSATAHTTAALFDIVSAASTSSDKMARVRANSVDLLTVNADGSAAVSGVWNFSNSTASSSTTTGALIVSGGVGIGGGLQIGGNFVLSGSSLTTGGALTLANGSSGAGSLVINDASGGGGNERSFLLTNTGSGTKTNWKIGAQAVADNALSIMRSTAVGGSTYAEVVRFDGSATAGDTRFMLYDVNAAAVVRVSVGANDSGGAGFKLLRVPN